MAGFTISQILMDLNLPNAVEKFKDERIDIDTFQSLTEQQLIRLGVTTIGDRVRLAERVNSVRGLSENNNTGTLASDILTQRNALFGRSRGGRGRKRPAEGSSSDIHAPRQRGIRTWSVSVVCLANKNAKKIPTAEEKDMLFRAGLGAKKIQFELDDGESDVIRKMSSDDQKNGDTIGFPQLRNCGGFELLKCKQNCRELTLISCEWNVRTLKACIGNQAKIYLRPIQHDLNTKPIKTNGGEETTVAKLHCKGCQNLFSVRELRTHVQTCTATGENNVDDSDHDELPDPGINNHDNEEPLPVLSQARSTSTIPLQPSNHEEFNVNDTVIYVDAPFIVVSHDETQSPVATAISSNSAILNENDNATTHSTCTSDDHTSNRIYSNLHDSRSQNAITMATPPILQETGLTNFTAQNQEAQDIKAVIANAIEYCVSFDIQNPVEILRYLQSVVVTGRNLEIEDVSQNVEGSTNFIMVDRNNLLETALDEINSIDDLRTTLEVQFYDETAEDHGGPRKEFFQLVLSEIKTKYFDKGLREYLAKDYITVGKIMGLSILQNGKIPKFMEPKILQEVFSNTETGSECIRNLRKGLDSLGLIQVGCVLPMFIHLLQASQTTLTLKALIQTLKPKFSEEGSNNRRLENSVYSVYLKYLRAVASGRRGTVSLPHVLQFATGTPEEPVLGFTLHPSIDFVEVKSRSGFIPTANTCINNLKLPRPSFSIDLPPEEELFTLYDYAFLNTFYGLY